MCANCGKVVARVFFCNFVWSPDLCSLFSALCLCYYQKPMAKPNPNERETDALGPAALVRTEAAALEALAARLDSSMAGPMAELFERAVEMILSCGESHGRV